jgi:predicted nucleic acid-binding protein
VKFADTGWWVAWALPGDRRHDAALAMLSGLGRTEQILTTNLVVGETWTFLRRKDSHRTALTFLDRVDSLTKARRLVVHRITDDQETAAWDWLRKHDERLYSYVDATSFRAMSDRRLREALAFDRDFAPAGFVEVRPRQVP